MMIFSITMAYQSSIPGFVADDADADAHGGGGGGGDCDKDEDEDENDEYIKYQ